MALSFTRQFMEPIKGVFKDFSSRSVAAAKAFAGVKDDEPRLVGPIRMGPFPEIAYGTPYGTRAYGPLQFGGAWTRSGPFGGPLTSRNVGPFDGFKDPMNGPLARSGSALSEAAYQAFERHWTEFAQDDDHSDNTAFAKWLQVREAEVRRSADPATLDVEIFNVGQRIAQSHASDETRACGLDGTALAMLMNYQRDLLDAKIEREVIQVRVARPNALDELQSLQSRFARARLAFDEATSTTKKIQMLNIMARAFFNNIQDVRKSGTTTFFSA